MAYITSAEVLKLTPELPITALSTPSIADVSQWCDDVSNVIDGYLETNEYPTIPASSGRAVAMIGYYVKIKVAAMALRAGYISNDQDEAKAAAWESEFERWLSKLAAGKILVPGQTPEIASTGKLQFRRRRFD